MSLVIRFLGMMSIGNMLEWYDFGIFMAIIPQIMPQFFDPNTPYFLTLVFGYGILAAGYLARPFGGLLLGHWGDNKGKARVFVLTLLLMSIPSVLIALLPSYTTIGIIAPFCLLLLRVIQGFSVGGECMNAVILSYELVPSRWRNLATVFTWMSSGFGLLLGNIVVALLQHLFGTTQFTEGFWRMAFLFGGMFGLIAFYMRGYANKLSLHFHSDSIKKINSSLTTVLKQNSRQLLYLIFLFMPVSSMFYLIFFYMPTYVHTFTSINFHHALIDQFWLLLILQIAPMILIFLLRSSNWKKIAQQGLIILAILLLPAYCVALEEKSYGPWVAQCILILPVSLYAIAAILHALEITPEPVRFTIMATGYNLSYAIFGNLLPLLITYWMLKLRWPLLPAIYLSSLAILTLIALWIFSPDTKTPQRYTNTAETI